MIFGGPGKAPALPEDGLQKAKYSRASSSCGGNREPRQRQARRPHSSRVVCTRSSGGGGPPGAYLPSSQKKTKKVGLIASARRHHQARGRLAASQDPHGFLPPDTMMRPATARPVRGSAQRARPRAAVLIHPAAPLSRNISAGFTEPTRVLVRVSRARAFSFLFPAINADDVQSFFFCTWSESYPLNWILTHHMYPQKTWP